jgi:FkbM family methyltransferase
MRLDELPLSFNCEEGIFFDVGANLGHVCIPLSLRYRQLKVYAFEPVPELFSKLAADLRKYSIETCLPVNRIVCDESGFTRISYSLADNFIGAGTIEPDLANKDRLGSDFLTALVECESLDSFCTRMNLFPDIIKIDVEGAESKVIFGGVNLIKERSPIIYAECGFGVSSSSDASRLSYLTILEESGYDLFLADLSMVNGKWMKHPWISSRFRCAVSGDVLSNFKLGRCMCLGNLLCVPRILTSIYVKDRHILQLSDLLRSLQTHGGGRESTT